jgi:hypothetical protein
LLFKNDERWEADFPPFVAEIDTKAKNQSAALAIVAPSSRNRRTIPLVNRNCSDSITSTSASTARAAI